MCLVSDSSSPSQQDQPALAFPPRCGGLNAIPCSLLGLHDSASPRRPQTLCRSSSPAPPQRVEMRALLFGLPCTALAMQLQRGFPPGEVSFAAGAARDPPSCGMKVERLESHVAPCETCRCPVLLHHAGRALAQLLPPLSGGQTVDAATIQALGLSTWACCRPFRCSFQSRAPGWGQRLPDSSRLSPRGADSPPFHFSHSSAHPTSRLGHLQSNRASCMPGMPLSSRTEGPGRQGWPRLQTSAL